MTTLAGKGLLFGGCVALGILTGLGRLRRVACLADFGAACLVWRGS